ncbi:MAG TPA: hypothetical protein RMH85_06855 [Polyangiaceae bacterium LLY-WYZ-15_(1-7)]|nr:hypothetical protein [Sandaracinus sp.]HJL05910.1 hypothetical protein [Polyangiaceae bacterium LLY-WYZ-15_(1-7)]HJL08197.1 hypothetical protein [Polyangiaceae bacterium LLY-WYZ-15_(1-7)]
MSVRTLAMPVEVAHDRARLRCAALRLLVAGGVAGAAALLGLAPKLGADDPAVAGLLFGALAWAVATPAAFALALLLDARRADRRPLSLGDQMAAPPLFGALLATAVPLAAGGVAAALLAALLVAGAGADAALARLPRTNRRAALAVGASPVWVTFHVAFPAARPGFVRAALRAFVAAATAAAVHGLAAQRLDALGAAVFAGLLLLAALARKRA